MSKFQKLATAGVVALCTAVAGSPAPALAQLAVIDNANLLQALREVIYEGQTLLQAVQTYNQIVRNVQALSNLSSLLSSLGMNPNQISASQLKLIFTQVYNLNPNSTTFGTDLTSALSKNYTLPMSPSQLSTATTSLPSAMQSGFQTVNTQLNRDLQQYTVQQQALTNAAQQRAQLLPQMQNLVTTSKTLTNGDQVKSLQSLVAHASTGLQQSDVALQYHAVQADKAVQDSLKQVETETQAQNAAVQGQQDLQEVLGSSPGSVTQPTMQ